MTAAYREQIGAGSDYICQLRRDVDWMSVAPATPLALQVALRRQQEMRCRLPEAGLRALQVDRVRCQS
jgi:hypothetical protein